MRPTNPKVSTGAAGDRDVHQRGGAGYGAADLVPGRQRAGSGAGGVAGLAGIIGGHWTPLAARQASYVVAHATPREGAAVSGLRTYDRRLTRRAAYRAAHRWRPCPHARPRDTLLLDGRPAGGGAAAEAVRSAPCRCGACESTLSYDAPRRQWWCSGCSTVYDREALADLAREHLQDGTKVGKARR